MARQSDLTEQILTALHEHRDRRALRGPWGCVTYSELGCLIRGFEHLAAENNVGYGEVVMYASTESPALYAALLSSCLGAFELVIVDPNARSGTLARISQALGVKLRVTEARGSGRFTAIHPKEIVFASGQPSGRIVPVSHITLTSGTLGQPKAVRVDAAGLAEFLSWAREDLALQPGHTWLECGDHTSDIWINNALMALTSGSEIYIPSARSPFGAVQLLQESRATHVRSVPQVARLVGAGLRRSLVDTLSSLQVWGMGGDVIDSRLIHSTVEWLPKQAIVLTTYGAAEVAGYSIARKIGKDEASTLSLDEHLELGSATPGTSLSLQGEDEFGCGELVIASRQVCFEAMTTDDPARVLHKKTVGGACGRYATGDSVCINGKHIRFKGRVGREIVRNGMRVRLEQMESLLSTMLKHECAVVESNGRLTMIVESKEQMTPSSVQSKVAERLPAYLLPTHVVNVERLPRGGRGKVDYGACGAMAGRDGDEN